MGQSTNNFMYLDQSFVEYVGGKALEAGGESLCIMQCHPSEALPETGPWQP